MGTTEPSVAGARCTKHGWLAATAPCTLQVVPWVVHHNDEFRHGMAVKTTQGCVPASTSRGSHALQVLTQRFLTQPLDEGAVPRDRMPLAPLGCTQSLGRKHRHHATDLTHGYRVQGRGPLS